MKTFHIEEVVQQSTHMLLKSRIKELIQRWFLKEKREIKVISILLLVETNIALSKANNKYKQDEIIQMLDFLIDNIFVLFSGCCFNKRLVFQWVRNVLHYSPICFWYFCYPFFFEKQCWINSLILDFSSICVMVVHMVEKSNALMLLQTYWDLELKISLQQVFRFFFIERPWSVVLSGYSGFFHH
jgi:hypothetical protein